jgi:ABC-type sugar transport system ATPase subunit
MTIPAGERPTRSPLEPEIEMANVSKRFGGTLALDSANLSIGQGEVHALIGQNGSGKSTLIKILAGFHAAEPGASIVIGGTPVVSGNLVPRTGLNLRFVHQGLGVVDAMHAVDNIALAGGYVRTPARRILWHKQEALTRELLARLGLELDVWKPAGECSAVERTGIAIARALAGTTPGRGLLVLDEPSVALAPSEVELLFDIVRKLTKSGLSILYVSHYLDEVFAIADRVTVLRDGRVIQTADVSSLNKRRLVELMVGSEIDVSARSLPFQRDEVQSNEPTLAIRDLEGKEVKGLSLEVWPGEIVGVAGAAGSGRAELPMLLAGAIKNLAGSISVGGTTVRNPITPRRMREHGLVLVPADRHRQGSHPVMSVSENLTLADLRPFRGHGRWLAAKRERSFVDSWSKELDVRPRNPHAVFGNLSGGNQQKVVMAKWLSVHPQALVLDEPTSGVDVAARSAIYDVIRSQAASGLGVLVCSSDVDELVQVCHRVLVVRQGLIVAEFSGAETSAVTIIHALEGEEATDTTQRAITP